MLQQLIVAFIVLVAVYSITRRILSAIATARATKAGACGSGCGCGESSAPVGER